MYGRQGFSSRGRSQHLQTQNCQEDVDELDEHHVVVGEDPQTLAIKRRHEQYAAQARANKRQQQEQEALARRQHQEQQQQYKQAQHAATAHNQEQPMTALHTELHVDGDAGAQPLTTPDFQMMQELLQQHSELEHGQDLAMHTGMHQSGGIVGQGQHVQEESPQQEQGTQAAAEANTSSRNAPWLSYVQSQKASPASKPRGRSQAGARKGAAQAKGGSASTLQSPWLLNRSAPHTQAGSPSGAKGLQQQPAGPGPPHSSAVKVEPGPGGNTGGLKAVLGSFLTPSLQGQQQPHLSAKTPARLQLLPRPGIRSADCTPGPNGAAGLTSLLSLSGGLSTAQRQAQQQQESRHNAIAQGKEAAVHQEPATGTKGRPHALSLLMPSPARAPGTAADGPLAPPHGAGLSSPPVLGLGARSSATPATSPAGVEGQQVPGQEDAAAAAGVVVQSTTKLGLSHVLAGAAVPLGMTAPGGPGAGVKGAGRSRGGSEKSAGPLSAGLKAALAALATQHEAATQAGSSDSSHPRLHATVKHVAWEAHMAKCLCDCPDLPEGTAVVLVSNRGQHHLDLSEGCRFVIHAPWKEVPLPSPDVTSPRPDGAVQHNPPIRVLLAPVCTAQ